MNNQKRALRVNCPIDNVEANVSLTKAGGFDCSHSCIVSDQCPTRCAARAVLADPEESVRMQIVCPQDLQFARIVTQGGKITWCSHEHDMKDCTRNCLGCADS